MQCSVPVEREYHVEHVGLERDLSYHVLAIVVPDGDAILGEHRVLTASHQRHEVRAAIGFSNGKASAKIWLNKEGESGRWEGICIPFIKRSFTGSQS